MTLQFKQSRIEFQPLNMTHDRAPSSTTPPRQLSVSMPRTQDTLASLYKRHYTLNQQLISTRLLLEQQQTENHQAMTLSTARDRANGKLRRKLNRLKTAPPPDSIQPLATLLPTSSSTTKAQQLQKQRYLLLQEEYQQWQQRVNQHQVDLEKAKERTRQAQQQLVCLGQTIHIKNKRSQALEIQHELLKTLVLVRDQYVDWTEDIMTCWYWLLDDDDYALAGRGSGLPSSIWINRIDTLKEKWGYLLRQDRALHLELDSYLDHLKTLEGGGSLR